MMEADVEPVARAIYFAASGEERPDFGRQPESVKRFYFRQAAVAIAEITRAASPFVSNQQECLAMNTFLICPVRGHDPSHWRAFVERLEVEGWTVHWPPRDTNQTDPVGLAICRQNADAIAAADMVHIIWDGQSQGSLFDLGVAFALRKPLTVIDVPAASEGKSFQNMMRAWAAK